MKYELRPLVSAVFLLVLAFLSACDTNEKTSETSASQDGRPKLTISGSSFASPFFNKVLATWGPQHQDRVFSYRSIGSGAGIEEFIEGTTDIGTTDAPLNPSELSRLKEDIKEIIVTSGMISIAYHLEGIEGEINLPREVYPDIFLGKINRWDDPRITAANPGITLPSKPIQVVARSDSSGTTFAFTYHLASISPTWKSGPGAAKSVDWPGSTMVANGNEGVAQRLAITKNSIGYVEFGFAQRLGLKVAKLENKAGNYILPSLEAGEEGLSDSYSLSTEDLLMSIGDPDGNSSYPIVAYTWALLRKDYGDSDKTRAAHDLMQWTLAEGQKLAKPLMYLPLSPNMVQTGLKQLEN